MQKHNIIIVEENLSHVQQVENEEILDQNLLIQKATDVRKTSVV